MLNIALLKWNPMVLPSTRIHNLAWRVKPNINDPAHLIRRPILPILIHKHLHSQECVFMRAKSSPNEKSFRVSERIGSSAVCILGES